MPSKNALYLGIDLGTTALKAAVFEADSGRLVTGCVTRLSVRTASDGTREQDPAGVIAAFRRIIARLRKDTGDAWRRVAAAGVAAQGGSTIIADRVGGKALTPMYLWNDGRAYPDLQDILDETGRSFWSRHTWRDEPGMGLARIRWMRRHAPALFTGGHIYVGAGEYLFFHLTREWRQDACHALQSGCYSAERNALSKTTTATANVEPSFFAPLREGHTTRPLHADAARSLGLPAGIPVAGPYMDHEAAYMAMTGAAEHPLVCSLGTAWVGNFQTPPGARSVSPIQLVIPSPASEGHLVIQPLLTGNVTWDWVLQTFVSPRLKRALVQQEHLFHESMFPPAGLVALPWLNRPNPFVPGALGAAAFVGLSPATRPEDLVRAVACGMVFELTRVFHEVKENGAADGLVLYGGASKGIQFQNLIAALFAGWPVFCAEDEDWLGARGSLRPFGGKAHHGALRPLREPSASVTASAREHYETYLKAFDSLYGNLDVGRACRIVSKGRSR
ncbi:MAG: FGGY family carbohydrate kinase [FCB group bacterium]|nr:FGGY family carbohydrate kinase [FCB group bacterium]